MHFSKTKNTHQPFYFILSNQIQNAFVVTDLVIMIIKSLILCIHISYITVIVASLSSNLLRTTINRFLKFVVSVFMSFIHPLIIFTSCLWSTGYFQDIVKLEYIQWSLTKEVNRIRNLTYGERDL